MSHEEVVKDFVQRLANTLKRQGITPKSIGEALEAVEDDPGTFPKPTNGKAHMLVCSDIHHYPDDIELKCHACGKILWMNRRNAEVKLTMTATCEECAMHLMAAEEERTGMPTDIRLEAGTTSELKKRGMI